MPRQLAPGRVGLALTFSIPAGLIALLLANLGAVILSRRAASTRPGVALRAD